MTTTSGIAYQKGLMTPVAAPVCLCAVYRLEGQEPLSTEDLAQLKAALPSFLLFATTWSVGATCDKAGRVAFDMFLKSKAAGDPLS